MSTQRYLVLHDYGMGGLWWWIRARSVREVRESFACRRTSEGGQVGTNERDQVRRVGGTAGRPMSETSPGMSWCGGGNGPAVGAVAGVASVPCVA